MSVRIPRIDRARTDTRRLPCIVVEKTGKKHMFLRLRCAQGVLKFCYEESDLELYPGSSSSIAALKVKGWKDEKLITLCKTSKRQNPCNKFYGDNCSCQKGAAMCCVIIGKPCTSHCHGGRPCQNEVEHITPGCSSSNSTIEGKDEAKLISPEAHRATAQIR